MPASGMTGWKLMRASSGRRADEAEQARLARQQRAQRPHRLVEPALGHRLGGGGEVRAAVGVLEDLAELLDAAQLSWRRASSGSASPASTSWAM